MLKYTWGGGSDVSLILMWSTQDCTQKHYMEMNFTLIRTARLPQSAWPSEWQLTSGDDSKSGCTELYIEITINIL